MFQRFCFELLELGWSPIPLDGKRPVIGGWQVYGASLPLESQLIYWCRRWRNLNVGLCMGPASETVAIDIDVEDPDLAHEIRMKAEKRFGETPLIRYGNAPKLVMVYRGTSPTKRGLVEVIGFGGQIAAFGKHPETKQDYFWEDQTPLEIEPSALPKIETAQIDMFRKSLKLPAKPRTISQAAVDIEQFDDLADQRRGLNGYSWRAKIVEQLQKAKPGNLHNTLVSTVASMARRGMRYKAIRELIDKHFDAPSEGPYGEVWSQVDDIINSAERKFREDGSHQPQ